MKKGIMVLIGVIVAILSLSAVVIGCDRGNKPDDPQEIDDPVDYYGCPNSKRIRKLNLKKSRT